MSTRRRSKVPFILGGCGCLSLILSMLCFGMLYLNRNEIAGTYSKRVTTAALAHYVNTPEGRTGELATNYVGFEFDYPKTWVIKPQQPGSSNFISVERKTGENTCENFNVGYFKTAGSPEANEQIYGQLIEALEGQFRQQFPSLRKVSEGKTKVGTYDAYQGLFTAAQDVDGDTVQIYTRAVILPTPSGTKGVAIIMMGTSYCELKQPEDLGVAGELPTVLSSFKFTE